MDEQFVLDNLAQKYMIEGPAGSGLTLRTAHPRNHWIWELSEDARVRSGAEIYLEEGRKGGDYDYVAYIGSDCLLGQSPPYSGRRYGALC